MLPIKDAANVAIVLSLEGASVRDSAVTAKGSATTFSFCAELSDPQHAKLASAAATRQIVLVDFGPSQVTLEKITVQKVGDGWTRLDGTLVQGRDFFPIRAPHK